jgi:hypothetical protein
MVLTAPGGRIPKDVSWNAGKKYMGNVDAFLKSLINFDKDHVPEKCVESVEKVHCACCLCNLAVKVTVMCCCGRWLTDVCNHSCVQRCMGQGDVIGAVRIRTYRICWDDVMGAMETKIVAIVICCVFVGASSRFLCFLVHAFFQHVFVLKKHLHSFKIPQNQVLSS